MQILAVAPDLAVPLPGPADSGDDPMAALIYIEKRRALAVRAPTARRRVPAALTGEQLILVSEARAVKRVRVAVERVADVFAAPWSVDLRCARLVGNIRSVAVRLGMTERY